MIEKFIMHDEFELENSGHKPIVVTRIVVGPADKNYTGPELRRQFGIDGGGPGMEGYHQDQNNNKSNKQSIISRLFQYLLEIFKQLGGYLGRLVYKISSFGLRGVGDFVGKLEFFEIFRNLVFKHLG